MMMWAMKPATKPANPAEADRQVAVRQPRQHQADAEAGEEGPVRHHRERALEGAAAPAGRARCAGWRADALGVRMPLQAPSRLSACRPTTPAACRRAAARSDCRGR